MSPRIVIDPITRIEGHLRIEVEVKDALGIQVPPNAELVRNLMFCAQYLQDHVVHFYHLHALDWVDVVSALKADPKKTSELAQSLSSWPRSSTGSFPDT